MIFLQMQNREVYLASGRINLNLDNFAANQDNPQLAAQSSYTYQDEMSYQVKGLILNFNNNKNNNIFSHTLLTNYPTGSTSRTFAMSTTKRNPKWEVQERNFLRL